MWNADKTNQGIPELNASSVGMAISESGLVCSSSYAPLMALVWFLSLGVWI